MKKIIIGLFCFIFGVAGFSLRLYAQIGSQTYQRIKTGGSYESAQPAASGEKLAKKTKKSRPVEDNGGGQLSIGEDLELTFPVGLKECRVFDSKTLEKAVLQAVWKGECEWIVLRPPSDWEPDTPLWLQMDKPLVLEDRHPMAEGHPLVITNDTGRAIVIKTPKNGGCSVIIKKPDVALLGLTFEGAVCR